MGHIVSLYKCMRREAKQIPSGRVGDKRDDSGARWMRAKRDSLVAQADPLQEQRAREPSACSARSRKAIRDARDANDGRGKKQ